MKLVYIFCNPLLQNIIQVNCLTLYETASVKVISLKKKKMTPHLAPYAKLGRHMFSVPYRGSSSVSLSPKAPLPLLVNYAFFLLG